MRSCRSRAGTGTSGKFYFDYQNEGIQSSNIDADQIARGLGARAGGGLGPTDLNRMERYYDVNEQNINWSSGTTYLNPSNIIGPRIVRLGVRFDW